MTVTAGGRAFGWFVKEESRQALCLACGITKAEQLKEMWNSCEVFVKIWGQN